MSPEEKQAALDEFNRTIIPFFLIDVGASFRSLKSYVRNMERQVPVIAEQERERLEATPLEEEEASNAWFEHHWLVEEAIPRSLRYSFVTATASTLEFLLTKACREMKRRRALSLSFNDLRGEGMPRALNYLRKVAGVDAPGLTLELSNFLTVRNCVVHANGLVEDAREPEKVKKAIAGLSGFGIDGEGYVTIKEGVCEHFAEAADTWLTSVLRAAGFFDRDFYKS